MTYNINTPCSRHNYLFQVKKLFKTLQHNENCGGFEDVSPLAKIFLT